MSDFARYRAKSHQSGEGLSPLLSAYGVATKASLPKFILLDYFRVEKRNKMVIVCHHDFFFFDDSSLASLDLEQGQCFDWTPLAP